MRIQSVKFYVNVPNVDRTGTITYSAKGTFFAVGEVQQGRKIDGLELNLPTTPGGMLEIVQRDTEGDVKRFLYQIGDILGRIEIAE